MAGEMKVKPRSAYSVLGLLTKGIRTYLDEYTEEDAIQDYLKLHPEANEADVRAELKRELDKLA